FNVPLTPGLPTSGDYVAHLADRDVTFKLNYDGFNSLKWKSNDSGEFSDSRVFTLNGVAGRDFVAANYENLYLLTACSGGRGNHLNVQAVYADSSTETIPVDLYDWFNQDGDENSVPVGVDGTRKAAGALGFRTVGKQGDSLNHGTGGDAGGAFLFVNTVTVNPCKTLTQLNISADLPYAQPFVVESRDGGRNYANFATTGGWNNESVKSTTGDTTQGIGSLSAPAGSGGTTATFSFTAPVTTFYNVYTTWAGNLDACQQAAYVVTQDGDPLTVFMNQRNDGNGWRWLGQVPMTVGHTYTVTLDAGQSSNGPRVYADAVRWETTGMNVNLLAATFEIGKCCNRPWADVDGDQDVDVDDFAAFQRCLTIGGTTVSGPCACLDVNGDQNVDTTDLSDFMECALGPGVEYIHNSSSPYWPNWPEGCPNQPAQ
ncbi:MAG: hypothetical protein HY718_18695, partial [Planctomycetes bacterium]|nr:hypothetical protein [Planctomycetota bacterium]